MAAEGARRARRGGPRDALDLRQRSRSAERRTARSGRRRAAGDVAQRPAVPRAHLAQSDELGGRRRGGGGLGGARSFRTSPPEQQMLAPVGRDRALVPARSARSARRVGDAPRRRSRRARDLSEREAVHALQYAGPGTDLTLGLPPATSGSAAASTSAPAFRFTAEPADRRSVHDAAQGSRRRHRAVDEAAQLRRHA